MNGEIAIADDSICQGLQCAQWAGRFEQWPNQIVLDGAHNSEGTAALIQTLKTSIQETIITLFMRH